MSIASEKKTCPDAQHSFVQNETEQLQCLVNVNKTVCSITAHQWSSDKQHWFFLFNVFHFMLLCTLMFCSLSGPFLFGVMPGFRTLIETDLNGCYWDFNEKNNQFTHHHGMNHPEVFKITNKQKKQAIRWVIVASVRHKGFPMHLSVLGWFCYCCMG